MCGAHCVFVSTSASSILANLRAYWPNEQNEYGWHFELNFCDILLFVLSKYVLYENTIYIHSDVMQICLMFFFRF